MFAIDLSKVGNAIAAGTYSFSIEDTEIKETQAGGTGIIVKLQILDGPYKNRYLSDFINVSHPDNPSWLQGNLNRLKQLVTSCGIDTSKPFTDPAVLKGQCVAAKIGVDKNDLDKNNFYSYLPIQAAAKPAATQANNITAGGPSWG